MAKLWTEVYAKRAKLIVTPETLEETALLSKLRELVGAPAPFRDDASWAIEFSVPEENRRG